MRRYWFLILVMLVALSLIPVRKVLIADWSVHVVDQHDTPLNGIRVSRNWEQYTFDLSGGTDLYTGTDGLVRFPKLERRAPLAYWLFRAVWNRINYGAHASAGTHAWVGISDMRIAQPVSAHCADQQCTADAIESTLRAALR